jgi:4-hydroxybenzoate polyprenyltransferase
MNYLKVIRPLNLCIIAATIFLLRLFKVTASPYKLFYVEPGLSGSQFLVPLLASLFIAAGGYVINDIYDIEIDAINRPKKVVIGYELSESNAYNLYKLLCGTGVALTLALAFMTKNYRLSTLPLIIMVILNFYAHTFKKQLIVGNAMIALCTAFTIVLIALFESADSGRQMSPNESYIRSGIAIAGVVYSLFAFLATFLREIIKDVEDMEGDDHYGARTIPIVYGIKGAKIASFVISLLLLLMSCSFVLFFPGMHLKPLAIAVAAGLVLPLLIILLLIILAKQHFQFHRISSFLKAFMCLGIASMLYFENGTGPYIFVQYVNFLKKLF